MALAPIGQRNFSPACVAVRLGIITISRAHIYCGMRKRRHGVRIIGASRMAIKCSGILAGHASQAER